MPYTELDEATAAAAFTTTAGAALTSVGETLESLRDELLLQLASRDDVTPERLDKWINWGYTNVAAMLDVKELRGSSTVAIVAEQPLYLLPVQVAAAHRLSIVEPLSQSEWEGRELTMTDFDMFRMLPEESAVPTMWFRWRRMAVVYPTPDAAYTAALDYRVRPDPLVNDTDSPLLTPEFHEPILLSARHRALRSLMMYQQAQQAMNDFLVCIRPLMDAAAEERGLTASKTFPARYSAQLYRSR